MLALSALALCLTSAAFGYYWLVVRPDERGRGPDGHLPGRDDGGQERPRGASQQAARLAHLQLSSSLTPKGWHVVVTNTGTGVARHVNVRSAAPIGAGVMPWVVEPIAPLHLPPRASALLNVILDADSAAGVECDVVYRDIWGVHKMRQRLLIDDDDR